MESEIYTVTTFYLEFEPFNIRPKESKLTVTCNCGEKALLFKPVEKDFGRQRFCTKCERLLFTVSKKIQWSEYVSGKQKD